MPRLVVVDQLRGSGGLERVLERSVEALLGNPAWEVTLLLGRRGFREDVPWPARLAGPNLRIEVMPRLLQDRPWQRALNRARRERRRRSGGSPPPMPEALAARRWIERWPGWAGAGAAWFISPFCMPCPRLPVPSVVTVHDLNHRHFPSWPPHWARQIEADIPTWLEGSRVVAPTAFGAGELAQAYGPGRDRVRVIAYGVERFAAPPEPVPGLPGRFLLHVGWISPHKNARALLEAVARLREGGRPITAVFAGPGTDRAGALETEAVGLGLERGRDFVGLGFVSDGALASLYRDAVATVQPSRYEGGALPLLEAIGTGCPVVCSRIPTFMEELGRVGVEPRTFDPDAPDAPDDLAEHLAAIMADPAGARAEAAPWRERVAAAPGWAEQTARYLELFEELVTASPAVGARS